MQYECSEAVTLDCDEGCPYVSSKENSLPMTEIKNFMLNKALPVAAHITALLVALGIVIVFSYFTK